MELLGTDISFTERNNNYLTLPIMEKCLVKLIAMVETDKLTLIREKRLSTFIGHWKSLWVKRKKMNL